MDIIGEQHFITNSPGFVWIGKTRLFNAHDSYINGKGNLTVYLFGLVKIVNDKGKTVDQAELLRWLGESVWMPTNLLPDENKSWTAVDENTAKITFRYEGQEVYYLVNFNNNGQITSLKTERYMGKDKLKPWIGEVSDYKKVNGMMIPQKITASWILEDGKYTYARFNVEKFEFDKPQKFD